MIPSHQRLPELIPWALFVLAVAGIYSKTLPMAATEPWGMIRDDGRHFVAWLRMLANPDLFSDDPIAEYFRSVTPVVFEALHYPAVWLRFDVVAWNHLIVTPTVVGLGIYVTNRLLTHFFEDPLQRGTVLALTVFFILDPLAEGLPRSFVYPILLGAFTLYLERRAVALAFVLAIGANLYPTATILAVATIGMAGILGWLSERRFTAAEAPLIGVAVISASIGLAAFVIGTGGTGDTHTLAEARNHPIFQSTGRTHFFVAPRNGSGFAHYARAFLATASACLHMPLW